MDIQNHREMLMRARRVVLTPSTYRGLLVVVAIHTVGWLTSCIRHKGLYRAAKILGRLVRPGQSCTITWHEDCTFSFDLADPYWSRCLAATYTYEAEVKHLFDMVSDLPFALLDCGANYGYWSIITTGRQVGCRMAIAVEPVPETFARLQKNAALNGDRFMVLNRALYHCDGETVSIGYSAAAHASAAIVQDAADTVEAETITLSTLVEMVEDPTLILVIKLDIEGAERAAMLSAGSLANREFLICYEDHGKDRTSETTEFFLSNQQFAVYFITDDGTVQRINSAADASALKHSPTRGYNFVATRPLSRLQSMLEAAVERARDDAARYLLERQVIA